MCADVEGWGKVMSERNEVMRSGRYTSSSGGEGGVGKVRVCCLTGDETRGVSLKEMRKRGRPAVSLPVSLVITSMCIHVFKIIQISCT